MAKRLTDTEKWNDDWYLSLSNDYRIIWQWLLDNCNHAGICKKNIRLINFMCNTNISEEDLMEAMEGRVLLIKNNWFIPKFLAFQYTSLDSNRPVIISVIKELEKNNLIGIIKESFGNDFVIIKEKRKDKDKDNVLNSKNEKNEKSWFSGNFSAQGEELFAERVRRNKETQRKRSENSEGEV